MDETGFSVSQDKRLPLGNTPFSFHCHSDVSCYLICCHKVELRLFPVDLIKLKNALQIHSSQLLEKYVRVTSGNHPYFPALMLNMADKEGYPCPFLDSKGCSVYRDRPSACRTYPLERGVKKTGGKGQVESVYFLTRHPYCKGHFEDRQYTVRQWERDQQLYDSNFLNDLWAEVDSFFALNPWEGEGQAGPRQQLAFMVCYNIDAFRSYCDQHNLLVSYRLDKSRRRRIQKDDIELLKFGFDWLLHVLGDRPTLAPI
jgi:Fe-S-cluster containining protein